MVDNINPTGATPHHPEDHAKKPMGKDHYMPQVYVSPGFKAFWHRLFKHCHQQPTDEDMAKMTDMMYKNFSNWLDQMKQFHEDNREMRKELYDEDF